MKTRKRKDLSNRYKKTGITNFIDMEQEDDDEKKYKEMKGRPILYPPEVLDSKFDGLFCLSELIFGATDVILKCVSGVTIECMHLKKDKIVYVSNFEEYEGYYLFDMENNRVNLRVRFGKFSKLWKSVEIYKQYEVDRSLGCIKI